jgi:RimJ/RimL family protein N-acetyltransferase
LLQRSLESHQRREPTIMIIVDEQHVIQTARLVLRPLRADDDARIFELCAHRDILRYLSAPPWPYEREHARAFVSAQMAPNPDAITSAITRDGALIGIIGAVIKPASPTQRDRGYAIGYWLGQPYWGQGFMSEAARAFIAHVFEVTGNETIYSGAVSENAASLRVQEKLGFVRDGEAMLYIPARRKELPSTNTVLTRARFTALDS